MSSPTPLVTGSVYDWVVIELYHLVSLDVAYDSVDPVALMHYHNGKRIMMNYMLFLSRLCCKLANSEAPLTS